MKNLMIRLVRLYQTHISPLKPPCCKYTPTCSAYAIEAFKNRGFFIGLILTIWRILRCNPCSRGGFDPVPERWRKKRRKNENGTGDVYGAENILERNMRQKNARTQKREPRLKPEVKTRKRRTEGRDAKIVLPKKKTRTPCLKNGRRI